MTYHIHLVSLGLACGRAHNPDGLVAQLVLVGEEAFVEGQQRIRVQFEEPVCQNGENDERENATNHVWSLQNRRNFKKLAVRTCQHF